jgi:hypothetical protein
MDLEDSPTFRNIISPPSLGSKSKPNQKPTESELGLTPESPVSCLASILKMETIYLFEMLGSLRITWVYKPEDNTLPSPQWDPQIPHLLWWSPAVPSTSVHWLSPKSVIVLVCTGVMTLWVNICSSESRQISQSTDNHQGLHMGCCCWFCRISGDFLAESTPLSGTVIRSPVMGLARSW